MMTRARAWLARLVCLALALGSPGSALAQLVVLDPGHGGHESGTRSDGGLLEKDLVLAISKHAKARLESRGYRVKLTREIDQDLSLGARAAFANSQGAAVFVSVHLNWSPVKSRRGIEVYVLSPHASDEVTRQILEREGGAPKAQTGKAEQSDLGAILGELRHNHAQVGSGRLARSIERQLKQLAPLRPARGLRQAPFAVLKGSLMPSVLVEMGYLSNADQARYFKNAANQRAVGLKLADGIARFLGTKKGGLGLWQKIGRHGAVAAERFERLDDGGLGAFSEG